MPSMEFLVLAPIEEPSFSAPSGSVLVWDYPHVVIVTRVAGHPTARLLDVRPPHFVAMLLKHVDRLCLLDSVVAAPEVLPAVAARAVAGARAPVPPPHPMSMPAPRPEIVH
jgi:hypothetical protein